MTDILKLLEKHPKLTSKNLTHNILHGIHVAYGIDISKLINEEYICKRIDFLFEFHRISSEFNNYKQNVKVSVMYDLKAIHEILKG